MEQRITRAKSRVAQADVPFETPGAVERAERLAAVAAMVYLIFNEGYSASGASEVARAPLCDEAIRLARLLLRLFQGEPEIMGLTALLLLQHARAPARFDADGNIVLLDDQDRSLWDHKMIAEGLALIDKAMRHKRRGPYQVQAAIAALHARAARPEDTDWAQIDLLYAALENLQPSPVVTLNRAVAVSKVRGPAAALAMIEPLAARLSGYFHFFGLQGALLLQLGRASEARAAFDRAIALANTAAEAAHIRLHLDRLIKDSAAATMALDEEAARKSEDTADNPQAAIEKKQRSEILRRCWSRLSPQHRDIIDLVYYQEKAIPEVAAIVGVPENTVKTRTFYARKHLAELLKGAGLDRA